MMSCNSFRRSSSRISGPSSAVISESRANSGRGYSRVGNCVDTSGGKLDELQKRVLDSLAAVQPPFILGGGAALAGVHLAHRTTRDPDLFWRDQTPFGDIPRLIEAR